MLGHNMIGAMGSQPTQLNTKISRLCFRCALLLERPTTRTVPSTAQRVLQLTGSSAQVTNGTKASARMSNDTQFEDAVDLADDLADVTLTQSAEGGL